MNWIRSPLTKYQQGDFVPIVVGSILVILSLPGTIMLLTDPERGAAELVSLLLVLFLVCNVLGVVFLWLGIRLCSYPGSFAYRITHARILSR